MLYLVTVTLLATFLRPALSEINLKVSLIRPRFAGLSLTRTFLTFPGTISPTFFPVRTPRPLTLSFTLLALVLPATRTLSLKVAALPTLILRGPLTLIRLIQALPEPPSPPRLPRAASTASMPAVSVPAVTPIWLAEASLGRLS